MASGQQKEQAGRRIEIGGRRAEGRKLRAATPSNLPAGSRADVQEGNPDAFPPPGQRAARRRSNAVGAMARQEKAWGILRLAQDK